MTFVNLLAILITIITYFLLNPVIKTISDQTVAQLLLNQNEYTPLLVALIYLAPVVILLAIFMSALNYAIPRREGYQ